MSSHRTFEEARERLEASVKRHLQGDDYVDSSEEDDLEEEVVSAVLQSYSGDVSSLRESFPDSCLICLSRVRRKEPIWNCEICSDSFHLQCIQKWGRDSAGAEGKVWCCPKCRTEYPVKEIPSHYYCYCGKIRDPPEDPWLIPHSCGETCSKDLKPKCGHSCTLLCHPGPCPPCPKVVAEKCHCGQSAPATRRCHDRHWSCNKSCRKILNCGLHPCPQPCHGGDCSPCVKTSVQLCNCKRHQEQRDCSSPAWRCEEKCLKPLSCGHHLCDVVCHKGECDPCKLSLLRRCPCGKNTYQLSCTLATPTCGDTCEKLLSCGKHFCLERCHRGCCGECFQTVIKLCRCGNKKKEVSCTMDYLCDVKCKNLKNCGKHNCNKKCCNGENCITCEKVCNKTLSCKNHKCLSVCHTGVCYPCTQTKQVSCYCGSSNITVLCGMEKKATVPKCKTKCKQTSQCRHKLIQPHNCHYGKCPPCNLPCGNTLECSHKCKAKCHDFVSVKITNNKAAGPWEAKESVETKSLTCPPCPELVSVSCLGEHDNTLLPCHSSKVTSCGRPCGRKLPCGNHTCQRKCHRVKNADDPIVAGSNCLKCEVQCEKQRPAGCSHGCIKTCHPGVCGPCKTMMWIKCHCGINKMYVNCHEWNNTNEANKSVIGSCKDQCPKLLVCGHRCPLNCHDTPCPDYSRCNKKVKLSCPCKKIKREHICSSLPLEDRAPLECQFDCHPEEIKPQVVDPQPEIKKEIVTMYKERRSRNRRNRRNEIQDESQSAFLKYRFYAASLSAVFVSICIYYVAFLK